MEEESVGGIVYALDGQSMAAIAATDRPPSDEPESDRAEPSDAGLVFFSTASVVRIVALASPTLLIAPGCPAIGMSQADGRPVTVLLFGAQSVPKPEIVDAVLCQVGGQHFAIVGGRIVFSGRVDPCDATRVSFQGDTARIVDLPALYARVEANMWSKRAQARAAWSSAVSQSAIFQAASRETGEQV